MKSLEEKVKGLWEYKLMTAIMWIFLSVGAMLIISYKIELEKTMIAYETDMEVVKEILKIEKPKLAQAHADRVYFKENSR